MYILTPTNVVWCGFLRICLQSVKLASTLSQAISGQLSESDLQVAVEEALEEAGLSPSSALMDQGIDIDEFMHLLRVSSRLLVPPHFIHPHLHFTLCCSQAGSLDSLDMYDDRAVGGTVHSTLNSPGVGGSSGQIDRLNELLQRISNTQELSSSDTSGHGLYRRRIPIGASGLAPASSPRQGIPSVPPVSFRFDSYSDKDSSQQNKAPKDQTPSSQVVQTCVSDNQAQPSSQRVSPPAAAGQMIGVGTRAHGHSLYKNAVLSQK